MRSESFGSDVTLRAGPRAPADARAAVTGWLRGLLDTQTLDDVRLVVSELITNSCRHPDGDSDGTIRLVARLGGETLRIEVRDSGHLGTVERRAPDASGAGGYGLNLVQVLTARWGVERREGTVVWCEIAVVPA